MAGSSGSESAVLHTRVAVGCRRTRPHHSAVPHVSAVGVVVIRIRVVIHHRKPRAVVIVAATLHRLLAGLFVEGRRLARIRVPSAPLNWRQSDPPAGHPVSLAARRGKADFPEPSRREGSSSLWVILRYVRHNLSNTWL